MRIYVCRYFYNKWQVYYKHTSFSFQSSIEGFWWWLLHKTKTRHTWKPYMYLFIYETFYKGPYYSVWFGWIKNKIKVGLVDIDFETTKTLCFCCGFICKIIEPYEPVNFIGSIFSPFATIASEPFTPGISISHRR